MKEHGAKGGGLPTTGSVFDYAFDMVEAR